jgi:hypothetical protein
MFDDTSGMDERLMDNMQLALDIKGWPRLC